MLLTDSHGHATVVLVLGGFEQLRALLATMGPLHVYVRFPFWFVSCSSCS